MSEFDDGNNLIKEMKEEMDKAMKKVGNMLYSELFEKFLKKYPDIKSFYWEQYTPHWCDGDTCEFGVRDLCVNISTREDEYEDVIYRVIDKHTDKPWVVELESINIKFRTLDSDILEKSFGDHVKVTVTREGMSVENYEHD